MPIDAVVSDRPNYVLMDGDLRIGPRVAQLQTRFAPIYGFSNKSSYEKFTASSQLALVPYPLVKVYLRQQVNASQDLKLVVIDATDPRQPHLQATTMEAVLEAHETRSPHVTTAHELTFDQTVDAYRVEKASA